MVFGFGKRKYTEEEMQREGPTRYNAERLEQERRLEARARQIEAQERRDAERQEFRSRLRSEYAMSARNEALAQARARGREEARQYGFVDRSSRGGQVVGFFSDVGRGAKQAGFSARGASDFSMGMNRGLNDVLLGPQRSRGYGPRGTGSGKGSKPTRIMVGGRTITISPTRKPMRKRQTSGGDYWRL